MTALALTDRLVRPRWTRLKHCAVRQQWLLLVPEQVLFPCPTTVEVLEQLEEPRSFAEIVSGLAEEYDAPAETIEADLGPLLVELLEQGYVRRINA